MSSPLQLRRKQAPKEPEIIPSPVPLPNPPQEEHEEGAPQHSDSDEHLAANTTTIIDPSDVPNLNPTSLLMSGSTDQTPRPPRSTTLQRDNTLHSYWGTSLPASPELLRKAPKNLQRDPQPSTSGTQLRSNTPVINVEVTQEEEDIFGSEASGFEFQQEESDEYNLTTEEAEALKILLKKPATSQNPVYNFVRKETKKLLLRSKKATESQLNSPTEDVGPEAILWMSALFGNTIRRIHQETPLTNERIKEHLKYDIPEISVIDFTKHAAEVDQKRELDYSILISEENDMIISYYKKPKPLKPWPTALEQYNKSTEEQKDSWKETLTFYPFPLDDFHLNTTKEAIEEFKLRALEASKKWRTPDTPIARVYPTSDQWKEGLIISRLNDIDIMTESMEVHTANKVQGKGEKGEIITRYFLRTHELKSFHKKLEKLRLLVNDVPFFPVPIFGISTRLERTGLSKMELQQASALYRTELEAYLLEIYSHICPTMSSVVFRRNRDQIWRMRMDLWKEDNTTQSVNPNDTPSISYIRDTPPHVTERRSRRATIAPPEISTIEEEDETNILDHSMTDPQNLRASIAARHVGTQTQNPQEPNIRLGRG